MMVGASSSEMDEKNMDAAQSFRMIQLWRLPDDFFSLNTPSEQRTAFQSIILEKAPALHDQPRASCKMSPADDCICIVFFLLSLGLPVLLAMLWIGTLIGAPFYYHYDDHKVMVGSLLLTTLVLSLHPIPYKDQWRQSRLVMALIRYFSMEILVDTLTIEETTQKLVSKWATSAVDKQPKQYLENMLPMVCLACPHGVFNYGAIVWCCISRWVVGWEQYTGAAGIVPYVPGLRYMDALIWSINADRTSIQKVLRMQNGSGSSNRMAYANGGMLGMVPDGILGAFQSKEGVDELHLGNKRGLMRICLQEGSTILASWLFGTTDLLTVLQDPFGLMQFVSRKLQAGLMLVYGRWFLPIPRRIPVTLIGFTYQVPKKIDNPTKEQVEELHQIVYGGLQQVYEQQKTYAGYSHRTLHIT